MSSIPRDANVEPTIYWYWGPTRTGKSKAVYTTLAGTPYYRKPPKEWWDGYNGQKIVWIDDFDYKRVSINELKQWLDRYPMKVEIKGGMVELQATTFYITCQHHPSSIYPDEKQEDRDAIQARCNIVQFPQLGTEPEPNLFEISWGQSE